MPFRLTRAESKGPKKIFLSDIPIGTTFVGEAGYKNILFLRTYDGLVSLDNPRHTWTDVDSLEIVNYRPVDIVGEVREI